MSTFEDTFQDYMSANTNRSESTNQLYNYEARHYLWGLAVPPAGLHHAPGRRVSL